MLTNVSLSHGSPFWRPCSRSLTRGRGYVGSKLTSELISVLVLLVVALFPYAAAGV